MLCSWFLSERDCTGDILREATKEGTAMHGKFADQGNAIYWFVGATANTQKYAQENKS